MHFSLLASLLMLLNFTLGIPLQINDELAADMFSLFENPNLSDATTSLESDPQDVSLLSPVEDLTNHFDPTSFIGDNNGNDINGAISLLLSSSEFDTSCPAEKRKRNAGLCSSSREAPNLGNPDVLDTSGWQEGSQTKANPFEGLGDDPCILRVGYPIHVCCRGPTGQLVAGEYLTIENCYLGMLSLFAFFAPKRWTEATYQFNQSSRLFSSNVVLSFDSRLFVSPE